MNSYKDLIVWQRSVQLAKEIYKTTEKFPRTEIYGLTNQVRRASVSVVSNIAEGFTRKSFKENAQFLSIAYGSTSEIEAQLILARELGFLDQASFKKAEDILNEVRRMLNSLLTKIKSKT